MKKIIAKTLIKTNKYFKITKKIAKALIKTNKYFKYDKKEKI